MQLVALVRKHERKVMNNPPRPRRTSLQRRQNGDTISTGNARRPGGGQNNSSRCPSTMSIPAGCSLCLCIFDILTLRGATMRPAGRSRRDPRVYRCTPPPPPPPRRRKQEMGVQTSHLRPIAQRALCTCETTGYRNKNHQAAVCTYVYTPQQRRGQASSSSRTYRRGTQRPPTNSYREG